MSRPGYIKVANDIGGCDRAVEIEEGQYLQAIGLYVLLIAYCDRQRTDGAIPRRALARAVAPGVDAAEAIAELERVGMIERNETGWTIPDYLSWQRSRAEIERATEQRSQAGRASAAARAKRDQPTSQPTSQPVPLNESLDESLDESLGDGAERADKQGEEAAEWLREASRRLSKWSREEITPKQVEAIRKRCDSLPSELRRAVDSLVSRDPREVHAPLTVLKLRLADERKHRDDFA